MDRSVSVSESVRVQPKGSEVKHAEFQVELNSSQAQAPLPGGSRVARCKRRLASRGHKSAMRVRPIRVRG
jgi:hypothetical protein